MNYMNEYKRLDNLLKEKSYNGISEYIKEIEKIIKKENSPSKLDNEYNKLKHYRWVRNKIAHEADIKESDLYTDEDIKWLKSFYNKISKEKDQLSIYKKIKQEQKKLSMLDIIVTIVMLTIIIFAITIMLG